MSTPQLVQAGYFLVLAVFALVLNIKAGERWLKLASLGLLVAAVALSVGVAVAGPL